MAAVPKLALQLSSRECSVSREAIEPSSKEGSMARKRYQRGQLWLENGVWLARWREDVVVEGIRKRIRPQEVIGTLKDYATKRLAQRALAERISHVNKITYLALPTPKFKDFADSWEKKTSSRFGDSTAITHPAHMQKHCAPLFH